MALTFKQLLALSSDQISKASRYRVSSFGTGMRAKGTLYTAVVEGGSKPRRCSILLTDPGDKDTQAFVGCNCDYFKYHCETALAARGTAQPLRSDGSMPVKRNPSFRPHLCVHLVKLATLVAVKRLQQRINKKPATKQKTSSRIRSLTKR